MEKKTEKRKKEKKWKLVIELKGQIYLKLETWLRSNAILRRRRSGSQSASTRQLRRSWTGVVGIELKGQLHKGIVRPNQQRPALLFLAGGLLLHFLWMLWDGLRRLGTFERWLYRCSQWTGPSGPSSVSTRQHGARFAFWARLLQTATHIQLLFFGDLPGVWIEEKKELVISN